jgi:apolipoprotein N-acyltransferase
MWHPVAPGGVPLGAFGPGVIDVAGERAAIWICYEQLLVWPVLESILEHPTLILAMANNHWVTETPIPRWQRTAVSGWSRLFRLPYLSAVNK